MSPRRRFRATALAIALAVAAPGALVAQTAPERDHTGVWWNANESGWGVFTIDFGDVIAPAWYTYDDDGEATWFTVAGAVPQDDGSYAGDVYRFTGVPFAQIAGNAANPGTKIGDATFRFSGEDALTLSYTIGAVSQTKQLTRFEFGEQDVVCHSGQGSRAEATNYSDLWWNPGQNGWGLTLTHVGDNLYVTWYTYGEDGEAIWFLAQTSVQDDGSFRGQLFRGTEGTPFLQINGAPPSAGPELVGEAVLAFSDGETGEFTYTVDAVTQTRAIERFVAGSNPPVCETVSPDPTKACFNTRKVGDFARYRSVITVGDDEQGGTKISDEKVIAAEPREGMPTVAVEQFIFPLQFPEARQLIGQTADASVLLETQDYDINTNRTVTATYSYTPPIVTPLRYETGAAVANEYDLAVQGSQLNGTGEGAETMTLLGVEPVTVPAGTFEACKFEVTSHFEGTSGTGASVTTSEQTITATRWTSPQFGLLKSDSEVTQTVKVGANGTPTTTTSTVETVLVRVTADGVTRPAN